MANTRSEHTASVLANGKVLVTGGYNGASYLASTELYEPSTGLWRTVGNMTSARKGHTASLLKNGKVLVTGGSNVILLFNSTELFNPSTES